VNTSAPTASQIQAQLQESEERWQLVLQGNHDGIWDFKITTGELFFSTRWKQMLGYEKEDIANHLETWKNLLHPDDREGAIATFRDYLDRKIPQYRVEFRLRCKDGSYKWILSQGQALWDERGNPLRVAGSHTDISERKAKEEAIEQQAARDSLLSRLSRQLIDRDWDTAIQEVLGALGSFTHSDRSHIIRYSDCQSQWSMAHEWCSGRVPPIIDQTQALPIEMFPWFSEQLLSGNSIVLDGTKTLPAEAIAERSALETSPTPSIAIVPMMNAGKTVGYLGLDADASKHWTQEDVNFLKLVGEFIAIAQARHEAETALRESKEAADAANRAKSEFLASMSHELRTPLNAILGFTQVMGRDRTLSQEQRQNLEIISRSGEHLLELINDILEMSKIEAGRTALHQNCFDLYRLLDNLEQMLRLKANAKGLELIFECNPDVPQYIQTDESKLRQVLINLLGNAIKFTEAGGVTLRVRREEKGKGERVGATLVVAQRGGCPTGKGERGKGEIFASSLQPPKKVLLRFEVEDTGPGIAPEEIDNLFETFGQTETGRQSQQGTGLGLSISQKFVQLMGGEIFVSSVLGSGSLFAFEIQVGLADARKLQSDRAAPKVIGLAPDQPQYRILVVDDRVESRLLLLKLLAAMGFAVQEAANGQEAIAIWERWQPHLIWMDMRMPILDGYEATRRIKSTLKGQATVIIALTASAFEEERTIVLSAGCDDFMRKPFREEILWEKMRQHLGVRYLYEQADTDAPDKPDGAAGDVASPEAVLEALSQMPPQWQRKLQQAAIECSDEAILALLEPIPPAYSLLVNTLSSLADNFYFDRVLELIQRADNKNT
jgi:two-component system sensor histidine kinase/response regulator